MHLEKVKWGIIGCGDVTEVKSGPAFNLIEGSELVAVMRRNAAKAQDYAQRHGVPRWYSNAEALIADPEVNTIYVATPPNAHAELAIKALQANKPVYVEKPMARNFKECRQMIDAAEQTETPLFVAYYRRALPGFLKVRELLHNGAIGKVKMVNAMLCKSLIPGQGDALPWRVDPEIAGAGHFFDLASHQLDIFDFLFGAVKEVKAFALNQEKWYKAEDIAVANLLMPNQVLINSSWCFTVPEFAEYDNVEIIGEKGVIKFSCFGFVPVELITEKGIEQFSYSKPKHVQQPFIQKIVDQLLGNEPLKSNAVSAARTNWVMNEIVKEYYGM